jgi:hypothetical protein
MIFRLSKGNFIRPTPSLHVTVGARFVALQTDVPSSPFSCKWEVKSWKSAFLTACREKEKSQKQYRRIAFEILH